MELTQAKEDCLKAIYVLGQGLQTVRSIDLAKHLGVKKPTISVTVRGLVESGYVRMESSPSFALSLTETGEAAARQFYRRHRLLQSWLLWAGVDEETAEREACGMEHAVSLSSAEKLGRALELLACPAASCAGF